jgi:hypothetical protein
VTEAVLEVDADGVIDSVIDLVIEIELVIETDGVTEIVGVADTQRASVPLVVTRSALDSGWLTLNARVENTAEGGSGITKLDVNTEVSPPLSQAIVEFAKVNDVSCNVDSNAALGGILDAIITPFIATL